MSSRGAMGDEASWRPPGSAIAILSPHLDDGVLSLGATIAAAAAAGKSAKLVTVLAGDPESALPASTWDRDCGYATAGEAARLRREEDRLACEIVGAVPVWLPYADEQYERGGSDGEIWEAVAAELAGADVVLSPGFPLSNPDHAWLSRLASERLAPERLAFYVEQPYASLLATPRGFGPAAWRAALEVALRTPRARSRLTPARPDAPSLSGLCVAWVASATSRSARRAKYRAVGSYASQRRALGRRLDWRMRLQEWACGGELIGLPRAQPAAGEAGHRDRHATLLSEHGH